MVRLRYILSGLYHAVADKTARDWQIIVGCIFMAAVAWGAMALTRRYTTVISHPITFDYDQARLASLRPLPTSITLDVTASGWRVLRHGFWFRREPIIFQTGNRARRELLAPAALAAAAAPLMPGIKINRVLTDSVVLDLNPMATHIYKVVVDSSTVPLSPGYNVIGPVVVLPSNITVTGPRAVHDTLPHQLKLPIKREAIFKDFEDLIALPAERYPFMTFAPRDVLVGFKVSNLSPGKLRVPVTLVNCPPGFKLRRQDSAMTVYFAASPDFLGRITPDSFRIEADYRNLPARDSIMPAKLVFASSLASSITLQKKEVHAAQKKR